MADSIKPYNSEQWRKQFSDSEIYAKLVAKYDDVYFERFPDHGTPRQHWATSRTSAIPFYYIDWIQKINPTKVYDLGCGWNFFKQYYNKIIAIILHQTYFILPIFKSFFMMILHQSKNY